VGIEFLMNQLCQFEIDRSQNLRHLFDDGDFNTAFNEVLRHFDTDETAPDNDRFLRLFGVDEMEDRIRIRDVS